ncbi:unnamed protein product, partial [Meganyctiphanes norvegica]
MKVLVIFQVATLITAGSHLCMGEQVYTSCPGGFQLIGGECLWIDSMVIAANYTEAEAICQELDAHLVNLTDANLLSHIFQYITSQDKQNAGYWTGARRSTNGSNVWQWGSNDSVAAIRLGTPLWGDWGGGDQGPDNEFGDCGLLFKSENYFLHNTWCDDNLFSPICHFKDCVPPYKAIGDHCFYVDYLTSDTWSNTKLLCENLNGTMAKINDANLLWDIVYYIREMGLTSSSYWIGGHQVAPGSPWIWTDRTKMPMGTPYWGDDDQDQQYPYDSSLNCAMLDKGEYFFIVNGDCDTAVNGVICEYTDI